MKFSIFSYSFQILSFLLSIVFYILELLSCQFPLFFRFNSPRESVGVCIYVRLCVCECVSVTTITKKIVDGIVPNFMGRFRRGKGRPSSCFVTIGRRMWKQRSNSTDGSLYIIA